MRITDRPAPRGPTPTPSNASKPQPKTVTRQLVAHTTGFEPSKVTAAPVATVLAAVPTPPPPKPSLWDKVGNFFRGVGDAAKTVGARVFDAGRSLLTGAVDTAVGVVKNVGESLSDVFHGLGQVLRGDVGEGLKAMGGGLLRGVLQTPVDALLMMGGRAVSAVQTLVGAEPPGRTLTPAELAAVKQVYGDTIDFSKVRLKTGDVGLFGGSGRAFVHGDTIYVPKASLRADGSIPPGTLVHEMGHVWQHQHGGTDYMSEALWAQQFGEGYDWQKGLGEGKSFAQLNPEQQAEFVSNAFEAGYFDHPSAGFQDGGVDYTAQLQAALADIKAGRGAP